MRPRRQLQPCLASFNTNRDTQGGDSPSPAARCRQPARSPALCRSPAPSCLLLGGVLPVLTAPELWRKSELGPSRGGTASSFPFPLGKFPLGAPADCGGGESASSPGVQGCSPSSWRKEALQGSGTDFIEASFGLLTLLGLKRWLRAGGSAPAPFLALNPSLSPQRVPLAPCWPSGSRQARNRAGRGETRRCCCCWDAWDAWDAGPAPAGSSSCTGLRAAGRRKWPGFSHHLGKHPRKGVTCQDP